MGIPGLLGNDSNWIARYRFDDAARHGIEATRARATARTAKFQ